MASLTTRAKVLQTLGLTDDATTAPAIAVGFDKSALTSVVFTTNSGGTTLTVTPSPGSPTTFTLTDSAYDTLTELVAGVEALASIECSLACPDGSVPSALLDASQTVTLNSSNVLGILTYSNSASGTIAAFIDQLITDVSAGIARYTGRDWDGGSRTETYDGNGSPFLQLRSFPVSSVTSVSIIDDSGTTTALASTDWRVDSESGRIRLLGSWQTYGGYPIDGWSDWYGTTGPAYSRGWSSAFPEGLKNVSVVYTPSSTVPDDLARVATEMVIELYLNRRANPRSAGESVAPINVNYLSVDDLIKKNEYRLSMYRRPVC